MQPIWLSAGLTLADDQQQLIDGVGHRMHRFGKHRRTSADQEAKKLCGCDTGVGAERDRCRSGLGTVRRHQVHLPCTRWRETMAPALRMPCRSAIDSPRLAAPDNARPTAASYRPYEPNVSYGFRFG
jgi:hypothetical protein